MFSNNYFTFKAFNNGSIKLTKAPLEFSFCFVLDFFLLTSLETHLVFQYVDA